jgi:pimeloyl-ACP methyl ester carboxylesterase
MPRLRPPRFEPQRRAVAVLIAHLGPLASALAGQVAAAEPADSVVTRHQIEFGGQPVTYTAEAGRIAIRDVETGEPHGDMFFTAYRVPSVAARPVTFIWNGGPGADSSLLHFSAAGPKLLRDGQLVENSDTWLAASDLVLVDPIGTGFSRPTRASYADEFYSTRGDVASVTEFVRSWRLLHAAEDTPVILVGESWGAGRAAEVGYALEHRGIRVNGLVLISGGWALNKEYGSALLRSALRVVDMASAALFYGKTASELGRDRTAVRRAAERWVRSAYAPALARVDRLTDSERAAIARDLSRFTGVPVAAIDQRTLMISPREFREQLLKGEGKQPYIFDLRISSPQPQMRGGAAILHYLRDELAYRTDLPYLGIEPMTLGYAPSGAYPQSVNARWNYATAEVTPAQLKAAMEAASKSGAGPPQLGPPLPATEEALELNPRMKVLVAAGMYDGFQPCASGAETEAQLPPRLGAAITFKCYIGGHAMYLDEPARHELSRDIQALIAGAR